MAYILLFINEIEENANPYMGGVYGFAIFRVLDFIWIVVYYLREKKFFGSVKLERINWVLDIQQSSYTVTLLIGFLVEKKLHGDFINYTVTLLFRISSG